jgi:TRAP-type C4-dicarboxylate transport system permease small subunit
LTTKEGIVTVRRLVAIAVIFVGASIAVKESGHASRS